MKTLEQALEAYLEEKRAAAEQARREEEEKAQQTAENERLVASHFPVLLRKRYDITLEGAGAEVFAYQWQGAYQVRLNFSRDSGVNCLRSFILRDGKIEENPSNDPNYWEAFYGKRVAHFAEPQFLDACLHAAYGTTDPAKIDLRAERWSA